MIDKQLKFKQYIKEHTNNDYELLGQYKGWNTKVRIKHTSSYCNRVYETTPRNFKRGCRCPYCNKGTKGNPGELFKHKITNKYGLDFWKHIRLLSKYINKNTIIKLQYKLCGHTLEISPSTLLNIKNNHKYITCPICRFNANLKEKKAKEKLKKYYCKKIITQHRENLFDKRKQLLCNNNYCVYPKLANKCFVCYCKKHNQYFTVSQDGFLHKLSKLENKCQKCSNEALIKRRTSIIVKDFKNSSLMFIEMNNRNYFYYKCKVCGLKQKKLYHSYNHKLKCSRCLKNKMLAERGLSQSQAEHRVKSISLGTIKLIGIYKGRKSQVKSKCLICGTCWEPVASSLFKGFGCPKCNLSHGEKTIEAYLKKHEYTYYAQYKAGCIDKQELPYDFYIPKYRLLIEYQGEQHYVPIEHFGGVSKYKIRINHDNKKKSYALSHDYNFLAIDGRKYKSKNDIINLLKNNFKIYK